MELVGYRIEFLDSKHVDKKVEPTPKERKWQLFFVRLYFRIFGRLFPKTLSQQAYRIFSTPRWRAKHTRTDDIIDSAKVVDFPFRDEIIKVYEWGKVGDPIVLIAHGWESRGTALRVYVKPLLEKGFRVIAYDAIAHGDSTGKRNNLNTNAQTIVALIHHYGGIHGIMGHSFGSSSIMYALEYVDNDIRIEKVVLIALPPKVTKILDKYFNHLRVPNIVRKKFYETAEQIYGRPPEEINPVDALGKLKIGQIFLVHDLKDYITPSTSSEEFIDYWENLKLLITEGYGHFRLVKNPDVIRRIVLFMEKGF